MINEVTFTFRRFTSAGMVQRYKNWVGSAGMFGVVAGTLFLYMSDWRVVVTKIPIYNSKFKDEEDSEKK